MKITDLPNGKNLRPLKIPAWEVPHAVLEPNYTCNLRCRACYSQVRDGVKSFAETTEEVDQLLSKRNLETLSILGGEPTLHPCLPEIVRYIKRKRLVCQLLTNGVVLLQDADNALLDRLVAAGLDRIVLHVDCGQGFTASEVERRRTELFDRFEQRRLYFALAVTIYPENVGEIPQVMRRYAHYHFFDGILATVVRDMDSFCAFAKLRADAAGIDAVCSIIASQLAIEPAAYLPSSLDDQEVRWLIYFYYLNAQTGTAMQLSPAFSRFMRRVYRLATGKHLFAATLRPSLAKPWFLLTSVFEILRRPASLRGLKRLMAGSRGLGELRFQYIVVQSAPQLNAQQESLEICYHCPDATIRNGRLVPVCLADRISPVGRQTRAAALRADLAEVVLAHLEEAA